MFAIHFRAYEDDKVVPLLDAADPFAPSQPKQQAAVQYYSLVTKIEVAQQYRKNRGERKYFC